VEEGRKNLLKEVNEERAVVVRRREEEGVGKIRRAEG